MMAAGGAGGDLGATAQAARQLLDYCRANDWAGFDPYDALNSRVFRALPFLNFRLARLALTQGVKRCPVNLRRVLLVPRTQNPKGIALFLSSSIKLAGNAAPEAAELIDPLADKLMALRSPGRAYAGWGYNFPWQQRHRLIPEGSPNIICTTFAGNALLDVHGTTGEGRWLETARSAAEFIVADLFRRDQDGKIWFGYTLGGNERVHNASLLGAAFLSRVSRASGDGKYLGPALEAARSSAARQAADGSWIYGEDSGQGWIDSFHTGFNLVALKRIREHSGTREFDAVIEKGLAFFKARFVREDGAPRYYHDATYPIDIHSAAQAIITLAELADLGTDNVDLARRVLDWSLANMWDRRGFFYYQKRPWLTVRTPFMRWSEAWMLLALATLLSRAADSPQGTR